MVKYNLRRIAGLFLLISVSLPSLGENWPCFRGPTRQGISAERGLPLEWSEESNVVWKTVVPGEAWSSAIVWEDRVFVTTTTEDGSKCHVLCFERKSGKLLWARQVFEQTPLRKEARNSYATPTPVTDGERVFGVFGDGSIVALTTEGKVMWQHREVKFYSQHGLGASPVLHGELLIMPFDGSSRGPDTKVGWQTPWDQSFILALDKNTGKERWRAKRGLSRIAHVTPNIMKDGREYLVSGAGDVVQGFDLTTGKLLWSATSKGEGVVPSIVIGQGLVFTVSGYGDPAIRAVRPPANESGEAKLEWEQKRGVPMIASMLYHDGLLYGITDGGIANCYRADTGEQVWSERVGGKHSASPVLAENRIYLLSEEGETTVLEAGRQFKVLARNQLNDKFQASLAISQRQIFARGQQYLYCLGAK